MGGVAYLVPMSALEQRITDDMKTAMRAKDQVSLIVIRSLKAGLQNAAIERGGAEGCHVLMMVIPRTDDSLWKQQSEPIPQQNQGMVHQEVEEKVETCDAEDERHGKFIL